MRAQLWLKLKSQRYLLPLFLVLLLLLLLLSHASSYVLADRQPPLSLAVQQLSDDKTSNDLVAKLQITPDFTIIPVAAALSADEVFKRERVQGLLVIPQDFGALLTSGKRSSVLFYPAPGITNQDFATEQIAGAVVQLKARYDLSVALREIGAEENFDDSALATDLLEVVYEGPLIQGTTQSITPVYGIAALLVLLAFLHAALTVPTREDKHLLVRGRSVFLRQLILSLLIVWIIWITLIALFFGCTIALSGVVPHMFTCLGFVVIMLYVSLLATVLAQFLGRHVASWVFLPLFLLSMTLGGGLWAQLVVSPVFAPLVPVAAVSGLSDAQLLGIAMLAGAIIVLLALLPFLLRISISQRKRVVSKHV